MDCSSLFLRYSKDKAEGKATAMETIQELLEWSVAAADERQAHNPQQIKLNQSTKMNWFSFVFLLGYLLPLIIKEDIITVLL